MKRFYKDVAVTPDRGVTLDGKPVRTPARAPLLLPTMAFAEAIAGEWAAQTGEIRPETMVLTGLANAAIDRIAPARADFAAGLARYAETDLLCYRADGPAPLVARQAEVWDPWLAWAAARYDVAFTVTTGILHQPQPSATVARIAAAYATFDPFVLAALAGVVTICGSAILGLAIAEGALDANGAWIAGQLDEIWQAEQWGEDPLAVAAREDRQRALGASVTLLGLL
jgi:chaperone required for assembly of F1-ATPase